MMVEDDAIRILDTHRIMAVSTVRPDGWPQTTIVGYANVGLAIYFLIFRSSQKFENIQHDNRISVAVGEEPADMHELNAFYAGAYASELTDAGEREDAWKLLRQRHPNLANFELPDPSNAAMMRAECKYVSLLDYRLGPGYRREIAIDTDGSTIPQADAQEDWGKHAGKESGPAPD